MVTHAYPRASGDVAGHFIAQLAEALVARGHTVTVVAPADRGRAERFSAGGVDVVQVRYASPEREDLAYTGLLAQKARTPSGFRAFLALTAALARQARTEAERLGDALIHAHWWVPAGWAAVRAGRPFVVTLHGTDVALLRGLPARVLGWRVLGRARRVTAVSSYLAAEARRRVWRPGLDVAVIPFPIETAAFQRHSEGGAGVVVLGRLTAQKRVDVLLRAVAEGPVPGPVTIVGDGPARPALEGLAAELGVADRVRFTGTVPPRAVPAAVGDADVVAFLGRLEGLGLAAAEAYLLGIPVVAATDGGGLTDLVRNGPAGRLVPPEPAPVAAALRELLGNAAARAAARREGAALRARLAPDAVARSFEEVYGAVA
jgi:glycosyltransferase involved in cell wall biosynthesis